MVGWLNGYATKVGMDRQTSFSSTVVDKWGFNRLRSSTSFIFTASLSFALSFKEYLRGYESGEILGPHNKGLESCGSFQIVWCFFKKVPSYLTWKSDKMEDTIEKSLNYHM